MSKRIIMTCDICGVDKCIGNNHYSDTIGAVTLSFKDHPGVQTVPLDNEDICTTCAKNLSKVLFKTIEELKTKAYKQ